LLVAKLQTFAQIEFVENKGQWQKSIRFKGAFPTGSVFLESNSLTMLLHHPEDLKQIAQLEHGHQPLQAGQKTILRSHAYHVEFVNASSRCVIRPEKKSIAYENYYIGSNPEQWASDCRMFQAVLYQNIYPSIDLRYYSEGDHLKYDFIIHPGGNPANIKMKFTGQDGLSLKDNHLLIQTTAGLVKELKPYAYQIAADGNKTTPFCRYTLNKDEVQFELAGHDKNNITIIDPAIIFSSFTGSSADNWGYTATPGPDGSFYAGGIVFGDGYPASPGAFQTTYANGVLEGTLRGHDIAIFKFSANGANRVYATYLGGRFNEQPHSMIVDASGNLIMAGRSFSDNYPVTTPLIGPGGNNDIVITKFNAAGTALIGSVRIGGSNNDGVNIRSKYETPDGADRTRRNYGDDARSEVILDAANNIILASSTQSTNFPIAGNSLNTPGGYGGGFQDGVILKFNPNLSSYMYGSYFGGSGDDACVVTSIDPLTGFVFVAGGTTSNNIPGNKFGTIYPTYRGGITDGFITQLRLDGTGIIKTSYLGTSGIDMVYGLKFDKFGYPYVMGTTTGNWPVQNAAYSNPGSAQFISKLKRDFSGFEYSTVFGNGGSDPNLSPIGFLVDRCENVYVSGWGGGINNFKNYTTGNTNGLPLLNPLSGIGPPDGEDFFFFVLKRDASAQLFGSNFGQFRGSTGDHVDGGTSRFDFNGTIYQAICANCNGGATFPTTVGAWQRTNGSPNCNLAAVKVAMDFAGVAAGVRPSINAVTNDTASCVPFRVDFSDTLQKGKTLYWDFGNGQRDTTRAPQFATFTNYTAVGNYTVRIIAEDSTTCNIRDTIYLNIKAGDNRATLNFNAVKNLPCTSLDYTFNNLSTAISGSFGPQSFTWDFGDGSPQVNGINASHTYNAIGVYTVKLQLNDDRFCNAPTEKTLILNVNPVLEAKLKADSVGCVPFNAQFTNLSGTSDVTWQFSDGTTTNVENPVKLFSTPGNYQVRIIARDPNTCNQIDTSAYFTFIVSDRPDAFFSWQPNPPQTNTPTQFTNLSTSGVRYLWNFGDGETSTAENPAHQYIATGSFPAQLITYNIYNCTDTFTLDVRALIDPLLDVPNAFTPGRFGENGVVKVTGFGIAKMDWRIYNRWGQLVFRSSNYRKGWDGTMNGKLQAMDVYTYTLDVEFSDGRKIKKTGDISLLR
jgi:gliding motility-associated-like protein